ARGPSVRGSRRRRPESRICSVAGSPLEPAAIAGWRVSRRGAPGPRHRPGVEWDASPPRGRPATHRTPGVQVCRTSVRYAHGSASWISHHLATAPAPTPAWSGSPGRCTQPIPLPRPVLATRPSRPSTPPEPPVDSRRPPQASDSVRPIARWQRQRKSMLELGKRFEENMRVLDAMAMRANAIAHNIANQNTPGFKRFEVVFEEQLRAKGADATEVTPRLRRDMSGPPGTNNVVVTHELAEFDKVRLIYDLFSRRVAGQLAQMNRAIGAR